MFSLKWNTFCPIMHIILHCAIDTAVATPPVLEGVMSAKPDSYATCCTAVTRNTHTHKHKYIQCVFSSKNTNVL